MRAPAVVLCLAGLDPSGGAGLSADQEAVHAAGAHPLLVASALTGQSSRGVSFARPVSPAELEAQLRPLLDDVEIGAVKLGMLSNAATIHAVCRALDGLAAPLVLDPVLLSSSGHVLLDGAGQEALREQLLPRAALVTPNLPELRQLSGEDDPARGAAALLSLGARAVLVKGGHSAGETADDLLCTPGAVVRFSLPRLALAGTGTARGTGCRLASFLAARLAQGAPLTEATRAAKEWLHQRLQAGSFALGRGTARFLLPPR